MRENEKKSADVNFWGSVSTLYIFRLVLEASMMWSVGMWTGNICHNELDPSEDGYVVWFMKEICPVLQQACPFDEHRLEDSKSTMNVMQGIPW